MKHSWKITSILIAFFLIAQIFNILTLSRSINIKATAESGTTHIRQDRYIIQPAGVDNTLSFLYILFGVLIGTLLLLLIIRFNKLNLWKLWYFLAVFIALSVVFFPYLSFLRYAAILSYGLAFIIAWFKLKWQNTYFYNIVEVLVYTGISVLFVPFLNMLSAFLLLLLISFYDMFAVWKSKHMVKMATFQSKAKLFSGLMIPKGKITQKGGKRVSAAILGGGDVAFPMLFIGTYLKYSGSFLGSFIITGTTTLALLLLFVFARKDRFYPAMPFITSGCIIGYLLTLI